MSKIDKLNTLHQRAERLLDGTGLINQPEEVQVAFINGLYKAADLTRISRDDAVVSRKLTDAPSPSPSPLTLQRHAIEVLTGVASKLANAALTKPNLQEQATKIMHVVDALRRPSKPNVATMTRAARAARLDALVTITPEQREAAELERLARNWAARDRRAGKPHMTHWQRVNALREQRDDAFDRIAELGEKSRARLDKMTKKEERNAHLKVEAARIMKRINGGKN